jgi:hypothetical protein
MKRSRSPFILFDSRGLRPVQRLFGEAAQGVGNLITIDWFDQVQIESGIVGALAVLWLTITCQRHQANRLSEPGAEPPR